jgi:hypothetical protein
VGHVAVATEENWLLGIEILEIVTEIILPGHTIVQTLQPVLRVGSVTANEIEIIHLEGYHAALVVVLIDTDAVAYAQGLMLSEDSCAAVAFLVGIVPITVIALIGKVELSLLHLCLLQTEEVGIQLLEDITEALTLACAQTVYIPTDKFHIFTEVQIYILISAAKLRNISQTCSTFPQKIEKAPTP